MSSYECTEELFLKDVGTHSMKVLYEDGLHRHLQFRKPDTSSYWFDIITWPGNLCITGDMGTYVFRRIEDMLDFFRIKPNDWNFSKTGGLSINPGYWEEKLSAMPKGGTREFDEARFNEVVKEEFDRWCADNEHHKEFFEELWDDIDEEILSYSSDGEHVLVANAMEYRHQQTGFQFNEFWDNNFQKATFHYIWCCYAIAWAVKTYDELSDKHIMELAERHGH